MHPGLEWNPRFAMALERTRISGLLAVTLVAGGCYTGASLDGLTPQTGPQADTDGIGDDGADATGGETGGPDSGGNLPVPAGEDPQRLWRLTPQQYERTISAGLGTDVELPGIAFSTRTDGFVNGSGALLVDEVFLSTLETELEEVVDANLDAVIEQLDCPLEQLEGACLESFLRTFTLRVQRTDAADIERYAALYEQVRSVAGPQDALRATVTAALLSPKTLFRREFGDLGEGASTRLTSFELADALAYSIWDGPPDDELLGLAVSGDLDQPAALEAQLDRMFADPKGTRGLSELVRQWLGLSGFASLQKTESLFPEYEGLKASMQWETDTFIAHVLRERDGDFTQLLSSSEGFVDAELAELYGIDAPTSPGLVELPAQRRSIFTQAAVVSAMSAAGETAIIYRGKVILDRLLCRDITLPPEVEFPDFDEFPPDATARDRFESLEDTQPCGTCHTQLHPPAFAMENYDPIGRFRLEENGSTIDASGSLEVDGEAIEFDNATELFEQLARHPAVHACFAEHALEYTWGRPATSDDHAVIDAAAERFVEGTDLRMLYRDLLEESLRRHRTKESTDDCVSP